MTLTACYLLGTEAAKLVNERQKACTHIVTFDGSRLASGIYFHRLSGVQMASPAKSFVQSRKSILLK